MTTLTYPNLYQTLSPKDRQRINEKVIWAVNKLTDLDGRNAPLGAKAFVEGRARQLIKDMGKIGWSKASKRFRVAIMSWAREKSTGLAR